MIPGDSDEEQANTDRHSNHTGCSTINAYTAMENFRIQHVMKTDRILAVYEEDKYLSAKIQIETEEVVAKSMDQNQEMTMAHGTEVATIGGAG